MTAFIAVAAATLVGRVVLCAPATVQPTIAHEEEPEPEALQSTQRHGSRHPSGRRATVCVLAVWSRPVLSATEECPQRFVGPVGAHFQGAGRDPDARRRCRHGYPFEL